MLSCLQTGQVDPTHFTVNDLLISEEAQHFFARVGALCVPKGTSHQVEFA